MSARRPRGGFTLLEVILATGQLMGCLVVLAELAALGRANANAVEDLSVAQRLCQNRLNEILAGALPLEEVDNEELEEEGGWTCSVTFETVAPSGLIALRVTVAREASPTRPECQFSLVQWIPDPGGISDITGQRSTDRSSTDESPARGSP